MLSCQTILDLKHSRRSTSEKLLRCRLVEKRIVSVGLSSVIIGDGFHTFSSAREKTRCRIVRRTSYRDLQATVLLHRKTQELLVYANYRHTTMDGNKLKRWQ
jgi:hypothetical protein